MTITTNTTTVLEEGPSAPKAHPPIDNHLLDRILLFPSAAVEAAAATKGAANESANADAAAATDEVAAVAAEHYRTGDLRAVLHLPITRTLFKRLDAYLSRGRRLKAESKSESKSKSPTARDDDDDDGDDDDDAEHGGHGDSSSSSFCSSPFDNDERTNPPTVLTYYLVALAALAAFWQLNVTGPSVNLGAYVPKEVAEEVLTTGRGAEEEVEEKGASSEVAPPSAATASPSSTRHGFRQRCLASLDVDGVSVYQHTPAIELFCLTRFILTVFFPLSSSPCEDGTDRPDATWARFRVRVLHRRLLSSARGGRLSDGELLDGEIEADASRLRLSFGSSANDASRPLSDEEKEMRKTWALEATALAVMMGREKEADQAMELARRETGVAFELTGALGKRTKWQQTEISQLVVLARSAKDEPNQEALGAPDPSAENGTHAPQNLDLNDDTLLENISFSKDNASREHLITDPRLRDLAPTGQPQLDPLDQIALLTFATIRNTFSPLDKLTSAEILPYATRVLDDKPTNWQIYTQALLVRSRIEAHRSRTQERSILQLQVIVDQIIADTQAPAAPDESSSNQQPGAIPSIQITTFLPAPKPSESAPVMDRLRYVSPLMSPMRWELESELAYAYSGIGSLVTALEIFKRLQLWPEVALCYHSVGQEDKARQVVRRQLYHSARGESQDAFSIDAPEVDNEHWEGEVRDPPPPHAPRLWCILGDLDTEPTCWERAWTISKCRYARAQRTLGEYYSKRGDFDKAREAYVAATRVSRHNAGAWARLGDIELKRGNFQAAADAFHESLVSDDDEGNAKTYSNLGTALLAQYDKEIAAYKTPTSHTRSQEAVAADDELSFDAAPVRDPSQLLEQSLLAFKRGASLAHSNWKIWDNVITIALRMSPPSWTDVLLGLRSIIHLRAPSLGEVAVDETVLAALVTEVTRHEHVRSTPNGRDITATTTSPYTSTSTSASASTTAAIYTPPRGTLASNLIRAMAEDIAPLITTRGALWYLVERLALWRRDYAGALDAAEKAWRALTTTSGGRSGAGGSATNTTKTTTTTISSSHSSTASMASWLEDRERWADVVTATCRLVDAYVNYGGQMGTTTNGVASDNAAADEQSDEARKWRRKAKSAIRSVMGKARDAWEGSEGWEELERVWEELARED